MPSDTASVCPRSPSRREMGNRKRPTPLVCRRATDSTLLCGVPALARLAVERDANARAPSRSPPMRAGLTPRIITAACVLASVLACGGLPSGWGTFISIVVEGEQPDRVIFRYCDHETVCDSFEGVYCSGWALHVPEGCNDATATIVVITGEEEFSHSVEGPCVNCDITDTRYTVTREGSVRRVVRP